MKASCRTAPLASRLLPVMQRRQSFATVLGLLVSVRKVHGIDASQLINHINGHHLRQRLRRCRRRGCDDGGAGGCVDGAGYPPQGGGHDGEG